MKRALQVSMVKKDPVSGAVVPETPTLTPEQINQIALDQVQNLALTIGALLLCKKAADTASELILIAGRKYI